MNTKSKKSKKSNIPEIEIIVGRIYAPWCPYCINMGDGFKTIGNSILTETEYKNKNIRFIEIEGKTNEPQDIQERDKQIEELNNTYLNSPNKITFDGYPTIFMISNKNKTFDKNKDLYGGATNFINEEKEKNMEQFKNWIKDKIDDIIQKTKKQKGGDCGCNKFSQRGGWIYQTPNNKQSRNSTRNSTRKSRQSKKSTRKSRQSRKSKYLAFLE